MEASGTCTKVQSPDARLHRIVVRLNDREKRAMEEAARNCNMDVSSYVRSRCLTTFTVPGF